jgi:hypothetical protein
MLRYLCQEKETVTFFMQVPNAMHCSVVPWHNCLKKRMDEKLFTLYGLAREENDHKALKRGHLCNFKGSLTRDFSFSGVGKLKWARKVYAAAAEK